jgi:hypothetical protein
MAIEGFSNRLKALFRTEANLGDNFHLNNFANQTLWYAQYFLGRDTMAMQGDKCYLVEKASDHSSWMPSAVKTGAYFGLAVLFIIPGTIARLLSLDSPPVRRAIFADRVALAPPPIAKKVKRSKPPQPTPTAPAAAPPLTTTSTPIAPPAAVASPVPPPVDITPSQPAAPASLTTPTEAAPAAAAAVEKKCEPVKTIPREVEYGDKVEIVYEFELSLKFFEALSNQVSNAAKVKKWLEEERKKPGYLLPFSFGHHLILCCKQDREKLIKMIPEEAFKRWHAVYSAGYQKLKTLQLTQYLAISETSSADDIVFMNKQIQEAIDFYRVLLTPTTNAAEWLEKKPYYFPFFFTLVCLAWDEIRKGVDPEKIRLLEAYYSKAKIRLYEIGAEKHLKQIPYGFSPGYCALVHAFTLHLTAPPNDVRPAVQPPPALSSTGLQISDEKLKELLQQIMPSFGVIIRNDRLFQEHKRAMATFMKKLWEEHAERFRAFVDLPSNKSLIQQWIEQTKILSFSLPLFSEELIPLIEKTASILDEKLVQEWKDLHSQCCRKLTSLGLTAPSKEKISDYIVQQQSRLKPLLIKTIGQANELFEQIVNEPDAIRVGVLLKKAKTDPASYCYPFYISKELEYSLAVLGPLLNQKALAKWKELHPKVCQKLQRLNLTEYLEEVPPELIDILHI